MKVFSPVHLYKYLDFKNTQVRVMRLVILVFVQSLLFSNLLFCSGTETYTPKYSNPFNEPWRWQTYSELIGKGCRCMVEDKNGTLWFGVDNGVYKYDGRDWNFYPIFKDSASTSIVTLCATSDGDILAGSVKGIYRLHQDKWKLININLDLGDPLEHPYNKIPIIETIDHSIWIGTRQGAVRIKNGGFTLFRENKIYPEYNSGKNKSDIDEIKKLPDFDVYSLFEDKAGNLWIGLREGKVFECEFPKGNYDAQPVWQRVDLQAGYIRSKYPLIRVSSVGHVFVVSNLNDGGINIYDGRKWSIFKSKKTFGVEDLYSDAIELKDGSMCASGIGRFFVYKSNQWTKYESTSLPFSSNRLILYETKNQNLYIIGLGNEVWKIDLSNDRWATLKGLSIQAESKNGDKWFLTVDRSVVKSDKSMNHWIKYTVSDGIIDDAVALIVTSRGDVWIAGSDKKIAATACFDGKVWRKQTHPKLGWGIDRRAVFEASDGSLWFGSASDILAKNGQVGGIVRYTNVQHQDDIHYEHYYANANLRITGIYGIGQTLDKTIWAGQLGFYNLKYNSNKWCKVSSPRELNAGFIDFISTSPTGDLWVGSRTSGVFFLNGKTGEWKRYSVLDGLSSNTIIYIKVESNNDVWVATNRDISHFDGRSWTKNSFHGFLKPKMDGISIKTTKDGGVWVNQNSPWWYRKPMYKDILYNESEDEFFTTRYYKDKNPPETKITFAQDQIAQPGNVILSWTANDPWQLTPNVQIQYSYRIDDNAWSTFQYKTSNIFLSVPSGDHTFEVRSRDSDFNVDPTPARVAFYVIPPVWVQPWFMLLIFSFLSTIAFFIIHLYKRNRIIEEISETKVRLFANISHDLRTPITLIIGPLLKVLDSPLLHEDLKKSLNVVNKNSHRLLRLINQVLDFRKMEAGQLKFEPKTGDIVNFLREEVMVFEEKAATKKICLSFESCVEKLNICFDPDKIEKIMFNLLSNAFKFTPQNGSVQVKVSVANSEKVRSIDLGFRKHVKFSEWVVIKIKDTGLGISKRNIDKIFDRFYQVQDHLKTAIGGTGIGLSIVNEMVKVHGGKIDVESTEGVGTTFRVKIPMLDENVIDEPILSPAGEASELITMKYPEIESEDSSVSEENNTTGKKEEYKILVVEDNLEMRNYIREELESEYEIIEAVNGEEGLEKAIGSFPDIIISDVMMPHMDGIEFCRKVKNDVKTSHIAVILLTARSSHENKMEGLEMGADDYLVKPFYIDELKLRLHNILTTRKELREKFAKTLQIEPSSIEIVSVDQKFIKHAIDIIEEHLDDEMFNVETFSKLIGMSRVSLYKKLKSLTNHSVQEFIFAIRLKRAAQLLKESGMTVTEIAYSVGFKDPSHFSKLFKKQFGVSPKSYVGNNHE